MKTFVLPGDLELFLVTGLVVSAAFNKLQLKTVQMMITKILNSFWMGIVREPKDLKECPMVKGN